MRSNEERVRCIQQRTAELKRQQAERRQRQQRLIDLGCLAACLALVIGLGTLMPGLSSALNGADTLQTTGAASLLAENAALGYILIGSLSFLLGICVTILLYRLHRLEKHRRHEDTDDEL